MPHRVIKTVDNKRGDILLVGGLGAFLIGLTYILTPESETRSRGFDWMPSDIGADEVAWVWVVTGVLAVVAGLMSKKHPRLEDIGYGALFCGPAVWSAIFALSAIIGDNTRGIVTSIVYLVFVCLYWILSSWPNPVPADTASMVKVPPEEGADE